MVVRYKPIYLSQVTDGASNTLMVGGKRLDLAFLGQPQADDNEGYSVGWNADTMRNTDRPPAPDFYDNELENGDDHFGSSHPGGVNIVLADGSVRFISYGIDRYVFEHLGNRSDGEHLPNVF